MRGFLRPSVAHVSFDVHSCFLACRLSVLFGAGGELSFARQKVVSSRLACSIGHTAGCLGEGRRRATGLVRQRRMRDGAGSFSPSLATLCSLVSGGSFSHSPGDAGSFLAHLPTPTSASLFLASSVRSGRRALRRLAPDMTVPAGYGNSASALLFRYGFGSAGGGSWTRGAKQRHVTGGVASRLWRGMSHSLVVLQS